MKNKSKLDRLAGSESLRQGMERLRAKQGWTDFSVQELLTEFLIDNDLAEEALDYLQGVANRENAGVGEMKNKRIKTVRDLDMRNTGGPFIPKGTCGVVEIVRRTGELWINFKNFGHCHLKQEDVKVSK